MELFGVLNVGKNGYILQSKQVFVAVDQVKPVSGRTVIYQQDMTTGNRKQKKGKAPAKKGSGTPKSDMLMSEDMEQGLLSEHHKQHGGSAKKEDFYRKKVSPRPEK